MTEVEQLRAEVAAVRREIADLRGAIFPTPHPMPMMPWSPIYPGAPWPAVASGLATNPPGSLVTMGISEGGVG